MDNAKFWWSSSETPQPPVPPVDVIGQSLRFRGSQWLSRDFAQDGDFTKWTYSVWVKLDAQNGGGLNGADYLISAGTAGSDATIAGWSMTDARFRWGGGGSTNYQWSQARLRDPSAWYHLVAVFDSNQSDPDNRLIWYINGVRASIDRTNTFSSGYRYPMNTAVTHNIGRWNAGAGFYFDGYMADVHFIDSQALEPTAFGRTNDNGVWVPREVDFTPAQMRFSDFLTCAPGNFNVDSPATTAFDGDNTTFAEGTNTGDVLTFAPVPGIAYNSLEIAVRNDDQLFSLNGGANTSIANNRTTPTFVEIDSTPGTLDTLVIEGAAGEPGSLWAVRITDDNGTRELTNPFLWSADVTAGGPNAAGWSTGPAAAFDGNTGTEAMAAGAGAVGKFIQWAPTTDIPFETLEAWSSSPNVEHSFNGVNAGTGANTWVLVAEDGVLSTTQTYRATSINVSTTPTLSAIRINGEIYVDGTNPSYGANGFHLTFEDPNDIGHDSSGNGNDFTANGFELISDGTPDYDLMVDSPTQNYATMNPLIPVQNLTFEDANLGQQWPHLGSTGWCFSTIALSNNDHYWECQQLDGQFNTVAFGISTQEGFADTNTTALTSAFYVESNGRIFNNGVDTGNTGPTFTLNNLVGLAWNGTTRTLSYIVDGTETEIATNIPDGEYFPATRITDLGNTVVNYGQRPLVTAPPNWMGDVNNARLQTQNLPAAPIANGRDHFQAITGPGSGNDGATAGQLGGNWSSNVFYSPPGAIDFNSTAPNPNPGTYKSPRGFDGNTSTLVTSGIENSALIFRPDEAIQATSKLRVFLGNDGGSPTVRIHVNSAEVTSVQPANAWLDLSSSLTFPLDISNIAFEGQNNYAGGYWSAIEIDDEILVDFSILAQAQNTFPNGLWWIKSRVVDGNTNQHQLLLGRENSTFTCPSPGFGNYTAPAGDSVAWCWDISRPAATGVQVLNDDSTRVTNQIFNHALGVAPEMIIYLCGSAGQYHPVFHKDAPGWLVLGGDLLDGSAAASSPASAMFPTVTDTQVGVNTSSNTNAGDHIALIMFRSVPGYSAFGSYTGNGDGSANTTDGVFIYTGFRPAWIMVKNTNAVDNWMIYDSTRNVTNPASNVLKPNLTDSEDSSSANNCDILSNGFKWRTGIDSVNGSRPYIYAAFAENPFQAPVTAR